MTVWQDETRPRAEVLWTDPAQPREVAVWALALAGICLVVLIARAVALAYNATDLFFDEAQYWVWSREPAFGYYSKPPLIAWIIGLATSVCGDGAVCIRSPSPILYTIGAFGVFAAAVQLYGPRVAFLSGVVFLTLPGVSLSSGIISTDVPLLAAWAWALAAFVALVRGGGWSVAVGLGLAIGVGLNAKYAMAYFVLAIILYALVVDGKRWLLASGRFWLALAIAVTLIAPNVLWNLENGFATLSHTADNANWGGELGNPGKALEFFGSQFGVFGPILFAALLVICWRAWREGVSEADALLLCFTLPMIIIVATQAFISRAHANWAAVSYVAASILVTASMVRAMDWGWLRASLAVHLTLLVGLGLATAMAGRAVLPGGVDPFARTLGWATLAQSVTEVRRTAEAEAGPIRAILVDTRALASELLYYGRDWDVSILAWRGGGPANDHFKLTRPYAATRPEPVLYISMRAQPREAVLAAFGQARDHGTREVDAGPTKTRTFQAFTLRDFRGIEAR